MEGNIDIELNLPEDAKVHHLTIKYDVVKYIYIYLNIVDNKIF